MRGLLSILVVIREAELRQIVRSMLEGQNFEVVEVSDGPDGVRHLHQRLPDLAILDLDSADLDDWAVLEEVRDLCDQVPVLVLSEPGMNPHKVRKLSITAEGYLTKPFSRNELFEHMQAISRHRRPQAIELSPVFEDDRLHLDFANHEVVFEGDPVNLNPIQYCLLTTLIRYPDQVLSSDQLVELACQNDPSVRLDPRLVKHAVLSLLDKLLGLGWDWEDSPIEGVRGFGWRYRLVG